MNLRSLVSLGASFALTTAALAAAAKLQGAPGENSAKFNATGPAGLAIVGTTTGVSVADDGTTVKVSVPLKDLDTGIGLRNKHLREKYLEVGTYPDATFAIPRAAIQFPAVAATVRASASGTMTIHGVSHAVTVQYSAQNDGGTFRVTGTVPLVITDFGIHVPSYLGITVKPNISVEVRFSAKDG